MNEQILLVSCKPDPHLNSVVNLLTEKQIPFFRLNTESLISDYDFSWYCGNDYAADFYIHNLTNDSIITGHQIKSVWIRRPEKPIDLRYITDLNIDHHNLEEANAFYLFLMYFLTDYYSIGSFFYDRYASSKMVQLALANRLGMEIPETCISNTKSDLLKLASKYDEVLLKPLTSPGIYGKNDVVYDFYATKIKSEDLKNQPEESFSMTANFCENYVHKKYEVRVTVMGSYIFTCKIDSQNLKEDEGKIDWRQGYEHNMKYEQITLPYDVEQFCRKFLRKLNLNFGCFDFIVRPDDKYVFLECNPNGQWGFIEDELKLPMTEALVDCLENKLEV